MIELNILKQTSINEHNFLIGARRTDVIWILVNTWNKEDESLEEES